MKTCISRNCLGGAGVALGLMFSTAGTASELAGPWAGVNAVLTETYSTNARADAGVLDLGLSETLDSARIAAGYNHVLDNGLFLGIDAYYTLGSVEGAPFDTTDVGNAVKYEEGYGARTRLGVMVNDSAVVYALAGVARTDLEYTDSDEVDTRVDTQALSGTEFGVGVQAALTHRVLLTIEGTYTDYGSERFTGVDDDRIDIDSDISQVLAGLAYRF